MNHSFVEIIALENLLGAWSEFSKGKRRRLDVAEFELGLMSNLLDLHRSLARKEYRHGPYEAFNISDPKPRSIHKAMVRDRVLHHAVYRKLYPFYDRIFIADSFSCRDNKGTHKAIRRFKLFSQRASQNHTRACWVLKGDIRKFFASIDQNILLGILSIHIDDDDVLWLLGRIIRSFYSNKPDKGLPLGNLTSQLLVNVYMNEFDQYVKHKIKARHYLRYADDFVLLAQNKEWLRRQVLILKRFLWDVLRLELHPNKVSIHSLAGGVDWLGWVHWFDHRVLRTATKRRILKRLQGRAKYTTWQSYIGLLRHGNTWKIKEEIEMSIGEELY